MYTDNDLREWFLKKVDDAEKKNIILKKKFLQHSVIGKHHCYLKDAAKVLNELIQNKILYFSEEDTSIRNYKGEIL